LRSLSRCQPLKPMPTMNRTAVYLDWDTARRLDPRRERSEESIGRVFDRLQPVIAHALQRRDRKANFRVYWRIYHGWHQGKTKTADRRAFEAFVAQTGSRTIGNVSFSADFTYSGELACRSRRGPIYDTLRADPNTGTFGQKMVDTLLACDLLHAARSRDYAWHVVVANDDDAVPAVLTAEAWQASVILLHSRTHTNSFLQLDGIAEKMELA
jgi:hypothetical protein